MERNQKKTGDDENKEFEEKGEVGKETLERVAAAKKYIESHYKSHMKHFYDRRQRYDYISYAHTHSLNLMFVCIHACMPSLIRFHK